MEAPGCHKRLTFAFGQCEDLTFLCKLTCWAPSIHGYELLGSLKFSDHSLACISTAKDNIGF